MRNGLFSWRTFCLWAVALFPISPVPAADMGVDGNLTANGNVTANGNLVTNGNFAASGNLTVGDSSLIVDRVHQYVGIGTQPIMPLHILGSGLRMDRMGRPSPDGTNNAGYGPRIEFAKSGARKWILFGDSDGGTLNRFGIRSASPNDTEVFSILQDGSVGIGVTNPGARLDVNGVLRLRDTVAPTSATGMVGLYSSGGHLNCMDQDYNHTVTSPHIDPRELAPSAQTSFSDPSVAYPFSFYHQNPVLGKEQAIDMAKLVAWVEKKMQGELGEAAGRLVYTRDLPAGKCLTFEQITEAQSAKQAQEVMDRLEGMPWVKVTLGADGRVPDEAFTEEPVYETVMQKKKVSKKQLDLKARRVAIVEREEEVPVQIATGRTETRLRPDYRFENGELYRKPNLNDVNVDALIQSAPQLPQWILDRIHDGRKTSMDIKALSAEIRKMLAARQSGNAVRQTASSAR